MNKQHFQPYSSVILCECIGVAKLCYALEDDKQMNVTCQGVRVACALLIRLACAWRLWAPCMTCYAATRGHAAWYWQAMTWHTGILWHVIPCPMTCCCVTGRCRALGAGVAQHSEHSLHCAAIAQLRRVPLPLDVCTLRSNVEPIWVL